VRTRRQARRKSVDNRKKVPFEDHDCNQGDQRRNRRNYQGLQPRLNSPTLPLPLRAVRDHRPRYERSRQLWPWSGPILNRIRGKAGRLRLP
jgi:hypothetical protein